MKNKIIIIAALLALFAGVTAFKALQEGDHQNGYATLVLNRSAFGPAREFKIVYPDGSVELHEQKGKDEEQIATIFNLLYNQGFRFKGMRHSDVIFDQIYIFEKN